MKMETNLFEQKRIELMLEMATKKYENEINSLKQAMISLSNELASVKRQVTNISFQQPAAQNIETQNIQQQAPQLQQIQQPQKRPVEIIDVRPKEERQQEFVSGAARNSEPARPRYGDYNSEDVSIEKFFYYGNKR